MDLQEFNPVKVYMEYLAKENEANNEIREMDSKGYSFTASGAGLCMKKHWYKANGYEREPFSSTSLRTLRLGTIFGNDMENAMKWWDQDAEKPQDGKGIIEIYTEEQVTSDKYKLSGHFDLLVVHDVVTDEPDPLFPGLHLHNRIGALFDYKTANSYKFKKLFGRNPDDSPSTNYEYQLGTYGMLIEESEDLILCDEIVYMANVYINKDNSVMKIKEAPIEYIDFARTYWEKVNDKCKEGDPEPAFGPWIPFYSNWECGKYCPYVKVCDSPYKKGG